jgi:DNA (cytosine-5)-methyltransferase 1
MLENYRFIDLFAGIGGFRIALESFGAKCVFSSEWDKHAQKVYQANFGELPAGDITQISENDIPNHEILCGGFPCQPFSISGKQKGFDDIRGTLFFDIARIVEYHQPKILFLENVRNFETHDDGKTLKIVKSTLSDLGYRVFHKVLNASNFGLPQNRERIYIVCFRNDLEIEKFNFPKEKNISIKLKDITLSDTKTEKYRIERDDINLRTDVLIPCDIFGNYPLAPIRIGEINKGGQGERIYHELGHAITLSAHGGGVGAKTGVYVINGKIRKLAPRECARLQGYPDSFILDASDSQAYKQFGNSVPINVLKSILKNIHAVLTEKEEYAALY